MDRKEEVGNMILESIAEHVAELGLEVAKNRFLDKLDEKKLRDDLVTYIESQHKYNEMCTYAEEIDFQGLIEYIGSDFIDTACARVFDPNPTRRKQARDQIASEAQTYCKAKTDQARLRVSTCIYNCLDIIAKFYKSHFSTKDYLLADLIVDAVAEEVRNSKDDIVTALNETKAELVETMQKSRGNSSVAAHNCQPLTDIPVKVDLLGRDGDVDEIKNSLLQHNIVSITSAGGVGKSAVAATICNDYRFNAQNQSIQFKYVAWITSTGFLKKDLCRMDIPGKMQVVPDEQKAEMVFRWLKAPGNATLLIIDNMDIQPSAIEQRILNSFSDSTRVVITSRAECKAFYQYNLHEIDNQAAICLLYRNYLGHDVSFDTLETRDDYSTAKRILDAIHCNNALLIELIGKMAYWENKELSELLAVIDDNALDSELSIATAHAEFHGMDPETDRNLTIQEQIRRLYKMSELSPEQSRIMTFFAAFPEGMKIYQRIPDWCGFSKENLRWLMKRGWIKKEDENYYIHPIVKQSVELQNRSDGNVFNIADYSNLINELINTEQYLPENLVYSRFKERAEIPKFLCDLMEREHRAGILAFGLCNCVGILFYREGNFTDSIDYFIKALGVIEIAHLYIPREEACIFDNIGIMYWELFQYEESLKYLKRALEIKQSIYSDDDLALAPTFGVLAEVYDKKQEYEKSEFYFNKAIAIYTENLGEYNLSTINAYDNLANMYAGWGKYDEALSNHTKAIKYYEKECGINSIETATAYNNIGVAYHEMGDNENARAYLEKCLSIRKRILRDGHPHTMITLSSLLDVYSALGDQDAYLRAKEVLESDFGIEGGEL